MKLLRRILRGIFIIIFLPCALFITALQWIFEDDIDYAVKMLWDAL